MASSKRSLSDFENKEEFPFILKNGGVEYPKLYSKVNTSDKIRYWYIYAELLNKNDKIKIKDKYIDKEKFSKIDDKYNNLKMYIYTEYGLMDGKITESTPTIIDVGKNLNRANETTIITQSLIHMRNLYLKKIKSGYTNNLEELHNKKEEANEDVFPMAVHEYGKHGHKLKYPCYSQYKLDGIRLIASYNEETDNVKLLSRRLNKIFGFDGVQNEVRQILKRMPNIKLDGELYNHDYSLQEISGIVRHQTTDLEKKDKLYYYVFDFIDTTNNYTFDERIHILQDVFSRFDNLKYVKLLDTVELKNEKDGDKYFKRALKDKYEGIIYKNKESPYKYSKIKEYRTYDMLKRKAQFDSEYEIVGYESGIRGKDLGCIIFIMQTKDKDTFKAVPNASLEERKEMFQLAENDFDNVYRGKMATIKYDDLSENKTPLRAKFIAIRDYE